MAHAIVAFLLIVLPSIIYSIQLQDRSEECGGMIRQDDIVIGNTLLEIVGTEVVLHQKRPDNSILLEAYLGLKLPSILGEPSECFDGDACREWGTIAKLTVTKVDEFCTDISWMSNILREFQDCFQITKGSTKWFGGPEEYFQHFPMNASAHRESVPYLPGDMLQDKNKYFGGVAEPYWLNSKGAAVWVPEGIPLFYSWNSASNPDQMCFTARNSPPYESSSEVALKYRVCSAENAKEMHLHSVNTFLGKPMSIPDEKMMRDPIWSTWAQFKANINSSTVMQFAQQIYENGYRVSQIEIDDNWESCYGDAVFDENDDKFPDPKNLISSIKDKFGYRVTLWIHPFVNFECKSWTEAALPPKSYFIRDKKGKEGIGNLPGVVWWWQGVLASYVDFTNPEAVDWWSSRLEAIRNELGIDSFKFDAGESNWLPTSLLLNETIPKSNWPAAFTPAYVDAVSKFGPMIEVRVGLRTQKYPIFVRMLDKDSHWGYDNGVKTLIPTLLQMSISGYPFVLPDMVGGNGYGDDPLEESSIPSEEMFVRWLQANVFMPGIQFSFVPWLYSQEVIEHTKEMIQLRERYADLIVELANLATLTGQPINRPIWWIDPLDETAHDIDDEFLLGDDLLVAPVVEQGAVTRDIYLPKGTWQDGKYTYYGPTWVRDYPATLFTLPYFTRFALDSDE